MLITEKHPSQMQAHMGLINRLFLCTRLLYSYSSCEKDMGNEKLEYITPELSAGQDMKTSITIHEKSSKQNRWN
jgi:hypothetical protein